MEKEKYYICFYTKGGYNALFTFNVFITRDVIVARSWVKKFNKKREKWYNYFSKFCNQADGSLWLASKYEDKKQFQKCYRIFDTNQAEFKEIKIR